MAKKETNDSQWVEGRLSSLEPGAGWQPDAARGMARFRERQRAARRHLIEWVAASFAGVAACLVLVIFLSPGACAKSRSCSNGLPRPASPPAAPPVLTAAPAAAPAPIAAPIPAPPAIPTVAQNTKPKAAPAPPKPAAPAAVNFKETGLPGATIVLEIYSDYECPTCALVYRDTVPAIVDQYVRTGKIKLLHRDFPLTQHQYSKLAARYANAAGTIGQYDLVVNQIFQTQNIWDRDGNVDAQVMQVLSPGDMQRVRELVNKDAHLDDSVAADMNMAAMDRVDHTPFFVVVSGGRRQAMPGVPQLPMLKTYLDQLLKSR